MTPGHHSAPRPILNTGSAEDTAGARMMRLRRWDDAARREDVHTDTTTAYQELRLQDGTSIFMPIGENEEPAD